MKTIYISGKIDGCDRDGVIAKFSKARRELKGKFSAYSHGYAVCPKVVDPSGITPMPEDDWADYIIRDLLYLRNCDTIYMLRDWKDSAGARIEHEFAKKLGLEIIYEEESDEDD